MIVTIQQIPRQTNPQLRSKNSAMSYVSINSDALKTISQNIINYSPYPNQTQIIAVTKKFTYLSIINALQHNIVCIGENQVQEFEDKHKHLSDQKFESHLIGHLQSNKLNKALSLFDIIQTVDSFKLAHKMNERLKYLNKRQSITTSLEYMGLKPGTKLEDIKLDQVFIGSCTNSRIEDLRAAAEIVKGKHVKTKAMVVPGSGLVKQQAEKEGLDKIFKDAGFEWRESGCSMCLAMNADKLKPGERCASTSNRNFEGRQGKGGRTHLVSPIMAAAAAISGHLTDVRQYI